MSTTTNSVAVTGGGLSISKQMVRTTDGVDVRDIALNVGQPATLSTRTSATAGTLTMTNSSHGIITGQKIDVSWSIGGVNGIAYNATVGTVAGTSVPFTAASGDALPALNSAVAAATPVLAILEIVGNSVAIAAVSLELPSPTDPGLGKIRFLDGSSVEQVAKTLVANAPQVWDVAGGSSNPFTGFTLASFTVSNGSTLNAATFKIIVAADNTP
jgi:hypothetical protein